MTIAIIHSSSARSADDAVDPHWNKTTCATCHNAASPTPESIGLKSDSDEELCAGCHSSRGGALPCRHSSGIAAGDHRMPDSYRAALKDGMLSCTTCHDLTLQCLNPSESYSYQYPGFLRDRSSHNTGEHCFECHNAAGYDKLNPHVMEAGDPAQPTCTLCHANMPLKDDNGWISADFNMPGNLNDVCFGCHRVAPHPGFSFSGPVGWDHLVVPSAEILENMKETEAREGFVFPLHSETGEMHCATCHNPHHETLEGYPIANLQGSEHRLRVGDTCQACHDL
jgi:predicted CXXCH cytochrome family protein